MLKKIYIGGRVTSLPHAVVTDRFGKKETELRRQGFDVFNPVKFISGIANGVALPWSACMRICISNLMECHELHLLPCWKESRGARVEREIALRLEMPIVYHKDYEADQEAKQLVSSCCKSVCMGYRV